MEKNRKVIVGILGGLLLISLGFICYDKFLKKDDITKNDCDCPKCQECDKVKECENTPLQCNCPNVSNFGEKINSFKEIKLTATNQTIKIGSKTVKVKTGTYENNDGYLAIDDYIVNYPLGSGKVHVDKAYITDKFIFFTGVAQDGEIIQYVLGEKGEIIPNNNQYQMHNFKIVDGYLHASGHIFCGLDGNCPDKDLLIKYIDNTLIVTEVK